MAHAAARFSRGGGIAGVLHAGGVLRDALLGQQTASHVRDVYAPKARGGQLILQVRKGGKLVMMDSCIIRQLTMKCRIKLLRNLPGKVDLATAPHRRALYCCP